MTMTDAGALPGPAFQETDFDTYTRDHTLFT